MGKKYLLITEKITSWGTIKEHLHRLFFEREKNLSFEFYELTRKFETIKKTGNELYDPDDEFAALFQEAVNLAGMSDLFDFCHGEHEEE